MIVECYAVPGQRFYRLEWYVPDRHGRLHLVYLRDPSHGYNALPGEFRTVTDRDVLDGLDYFLKREGKGGIMDRETVIAEAARIAGMAYRLKAEDLEAVVNAGTLSAQNQAVMRAVLRFRRELADYERAAKVTLPQQAVRELAKALGLEEQTLE